MYTIAVERGGYYLIHRPAPDVVFERVPGGYGQCSSADRVYAELDFVKGGHPLFAGSSREPGAQTPRSRAPERMTQVGSMSELVSQIERLGGRLSSDAGASASALVQVVWPAEWRYRLGPEFKFDPLELGVLPEPPPCLEAYPGAVCFGRNEGR